VDLHQGECFFAAQPKANSLTVAAHFNDLATHAHTQGATKLTVLLDRNSTHGPKMRQALLELQPLIPVVFLYVAAYSPHLNPVEYLIHLIRLALLHHADPTQNLAQVQKRLEKNVHKKIWLSPEQLIKLLSFIDKNVPPPKND
jgi:DDE superfamily endonuclease